MSTTNDIVTDFIRKGKAWQYEINENFAGGEEKFLCLETGNFPVYLFDAKFLIRDTNFAFSFTEDGDFVTGGAQIKRFNRRRDREDDTDSVPMTDAEILDTATEGTDEILSLGVTASGETGNKRGSGSYDNDFLLILNPNTKYVLKITNQDGSASGEARVIAVFGQEIPFNVNG